MKTKTATTNKTQSSLEKELRKCEKDLFNGLRRPRVSRKCADAITAVLVLDLSRLKNGLESMIPDKKARKRVLYFAKSHCAKK